MATFPILRLHDALSLMYISVSINRMLISEFKRFIGVKFVSTSIQCLILHLFLISVQCAVVIHIIQMFQTQYVPTMRSLLLLQ